MTRTDLHDYTSRPVVDVLFGTAEPTGKLSCSIPRHSGQIPEYHHQHAGTGCRNPLPPDALLSEVVISDV